MERLTENDRGTFLVTTKSGTTHLWEIIDSHGEPFVSVTRRPSNPGHWSMQGFPNGRPVTATRVDAWPEVGGFFLYHMHGDIPWTRSSRIVSIERIADEPVTVEDRRAMGDDMLYPTHDLFGNWEN